jgi:hypothetical protein
MYGYKIGLKKVGESVPAAPANVVQPLLSGSGAVDTVVTSSSGTWTGFPSPTFNYDFKLNTVSVQSGASNTFTPGSINEGETLTVTVTATNTQGSASVDSSNSLVVGTIPVNTVAPTVFGDNTFGSTLTTTDGTFTGTAPITYTYQWQRGGSPITGETANTYLIGASDSLAAITCVVTGTNSYGFDSEVSNTITVENFAPVNTVAPTVSPSGTQSVGTVITANDGTWSGVAPITFEYKWTRNNVAISGATATTYTIQLADDGTTIRVEVKGTNTYGTTAYIASSNSVSAVNTVAPTNSVAPVISGTAVVGQVLTTTDGTWTGVPTPTFSYQWKRGATNIGTNAATYTLVAADASQSITCVVTGTNAGGSANATSNALSILTTLLDVYPNAASAYSVRLLRGGFYGSNAIRVRRSSDNLEQNIGFTSTGELDTSAITTFVGANNGFIVTWFDQSGNALNATQATPTQQPQIVASGVLVVKNTKASPSFVDLSAGVLGPFMTVPVWHTAAQAQVWTFTVNTQNITSANGNYIYGSNPTDRGLILMYFNRLFRTGTIRTTNSIANSVAVYTDGVTLQRTDRANRVNVTTWTNGTQVINIADANTNFNLPTNYYLGNSQGNTSTINANYSELINYVADQSTDKVAIENNQKSYYGI